GTARRAPLRLTFTGARAAEPGSLRRVAALAAIALALAALDVGLVHLRLGRRDAALATAIMAEAAAALPGTRLVAPQAQLESAAAAATRRDVRFGARGSVLEL